MNTLIPFYITFSLFFLFLQQLSEHTIEFSSITQEIESEEIFSDSFWRSPSKLIWLITFLLYEEAEAYTQSNQ